MHSSGSMTRKLGPSWKQSTGQTSTQSVYLHFTQASATTYVIRNYPDELINAQILAGGNFDVAYRHKTEFSSIAGGPGGPGRGRRPRRRGGGRRRGAGGGI